MVHKLMNSFTIRLLLNLSSLKDISRWSSKVSPTMHLSHYKNLIDIYILFLFLLLIFFSSLLFNSIMTEVINAFKEVISR